MLITVEIAGNVDRYVAVRGVDRIQRTIEPGLVMLELFDIQDKKLAEFYNPLGYTVAK